MIFSSVSGDFVRNGVDFAVDRDVTGLATLNNTAMYPLVSIQLQSTKYAARVTPIVVSVVGTSNSYFRWAIIKNPTFTGTALSYTPLTGSAIQYNNSATNATTVSGGTIIVSGYGTSSTQATLELGGDAILATNDIFVLAAAKLTGSAETFFGSMGWHELAQTP